MKSFWLLFVLLGYAHSFDLPEPTGAYVTGVRDFEFLDSTYPSPFSFDTEGRRLMVRAWYPAILKTDFQNNTGGSSANFGMPKKYFEDGEFEAFFGEAAPDVATAVETFSYINAPIMAPDDSGRSVVIYGHGAGSYVSDNSALMEEIASHGYAVFALGYPGIASGVLFPNGDVVNIADEFLAPSLLAPFPNETNADIETRFEVMEKYLKQEQDAGFAGRCRDDMLALADYLVDASNNATSWLGQLLGDGSALDFIYMGYSYGGAAAGSAGQEDSARRVKGAVNVDGLHQLMDLFGRAIEVPFLTFSSHRESDLPYYINEFFFEPLESMGTNPNVTRVTMPPNVTHGDMTDFKFLAQEFRQEFFGLDGLVDGPHLHDVLVSFCMGFLDTVTGQRLDWTPSNSFNQFQDTDPVDVSYVADWANGQDIPSTAAPTMSSAPMWAPAVISDSLGITALTMLYTIGVMLLS